MQKRTALSPVGQEEEMTAENFLRARAEDRTVRSSCELKFEWETVIGAKVKDAAHRKVRLHLVGLK